MTLMEAALDTAPEGGASWGAAGAAERMPAARRITSARRSAGGRGGHVLDGVRGGGQTEQYEGTGGGGRGRGSLAEAGSEEATRRLLSDKMVSPYSSSVTSDEGCLATLKEAFGVAAEAPPGPFVSAAHAAEATLAAMSISRLSVMRMAMSSQSGSMKVPCHVGVTPPAHSKHSEHECCARVNFLSRGSGVDAGAG